MIYLNACFLRCLRDLEKWSWIGKMGKNEEKWGKKLAPESPFIHYSPLRPFLTIILRRRFFLSAMGILFLKRARDKFEKFVRLTRGRALALPLVEDLGRSKKKRKIFASYSDGTQRKDGQMMVHRWHA